MSRTLIICFFALDKTISYHKLMSSVSLFPDAHRCTFSFCYSTNCFSLIHLLVINSNSQRFRLLLCLDTLFDDFYFSIG